MLEETLGKKKLNIQLDTSAVNVESTESAEDKLVSEQAKQFKDLANKVESFVEGEGDIEGARFEECVHPLSHLIRLGLTHFQRRIF